jgi:hypothetical protein
MRAIEYAGIHMSESKSDNEQEPIQPIIIPAMEQKGFTENDRQEVLAGLRKVYGDKWVEDHKESLDEQWEFVKNF